MLLPCVENVGILQLFSIISRSLKYLLFSQKQKERKYNFLKYQMSRCFAYASENCSIYFPPLKQY